eukprot:TRINITY_DN3407_c0_g1_i4.p1 TRINITY_DN3407_c0_g1~~TRINITY_DN3407_c0_g1_i4.p1  ORF type:complete len:409 (+),score=108.68 TRINITY_DN3407_c0_g1_i4:310-1536(+)
METSDSSFVPKEIKLEPGLIPQNPIVTSTVPSVPKVLSSVPPGRPAVSIPSLQSNQSQKGIKPIVSNNPISSPIKQENGSLNQAKRLKTSNVSNGNHVSSNQNLKQEEGKEGIGAGKTGEKPKSFNQFWSNEEQKKLEELLVIYPEEEVSAQRWKKIASHLPNRMPRQVASRVQKYFGKLEKMGKPLPGAMDIEKRRRLDKVAKPPSSPSPMPSPMSKPTPIQESNLSHNNTNSNTNLNNNNNNYSTAPPSKRQKAQQGLMEGKYYQKPLVMMSDDDSDDDNIEEDEEFKELGLDVAQVKDTEEYKELVELLKSQRRLKKAKPNERVLNKSEIQPEHEGFSCDGCSMEPIIGNLYSCTECTKEDEVDLCEACYTKGDFENEKHKKDHKFNKIERPEEDKPYFLQYNYE